MGASGISTAQGFQASRALIDLRLAALVGVALFFCFAPTAGGRTAVPRPAAASVASDARRDKRVKLVRDGTSMNSSGPGDRAYGETMHMARPTLEICP